METSTIFPFFEKGQPLRSRDLNAVFRRSDDEVRHTRTCLQGMGILYGLHVRAEENRITIQAGAGVTSQGYLYCSHEPVLFESLTGNSKIIRRQFGAESFGQYLDRPSDSDELNDEVAHKLFIGNGEPQPGVAPENIRDLVKGAWLIVLFSADEQKTDGCATCEKGTKVTINTKFLLVDDESWKNLTFECGEATGTAVTNTFTPELIKLPRLGLQGACIGWGDGNLGQMYEDSIKAIFPALKAELIETFALADRLFGMTGKAEAENFDATALLTNLNGQYVHDYLRLIIRAYNEFVSKPFARHMAVLPPETCFPKHLVLGKFDDNGIFSEEQRTKLYRPPFDDATDEDFDYARDLYARLIALLKNQDLEGLAGKQELRITPSRRAAYPIGMQAIPFYLNANEELKSFWRPANEFAGLVLSYDNTKTLQQQPFFDEADFYRIEGHVGQKIASVMISLTGNGDGDFGQRGCLNLPFEVVVVALRGDGSRIPDLAGFAGQYPGLEHQGGVPAGGTFVLVVAGAENQIVVGDFCLPYWVQQPVVADFEIESQETTANGETFVFVNRTKDFDRLEWRVNDGPALSSGETFTHTFTSNGNLQVTHYLVTLTAFRNNQISVEKVTVVVVRVKEPVVPPKAVFAVENKDNVETSDDGNTISITVMQEVAEGRPFDFELAFENLSENADTYLWRVGSAKQPKPTTKDKFIRSFRWKLSEIESGKRFTVQLTASKEGQEDSVAKKEIIAVFPQIL